MKSKIVSLIGKIVLLETTSIFMTPIIIGKLLTVDVDEIELELPIRLQMKMTSTTHISIIGLPFIPIPKYITEKLSILMGQIVSYIEAPTEVQKQYFDFVIKEKATQAGITLASGGDLDSIGKKR